MGDTRWGELEGKEVVAVGGGDSLGAVALDSERPWEFGDNSTAQLGESFWSSLIMRQRLPFCAEVVCEAVPGKRDWKDRVLMRHDTSIWCKLFSKPPQGSVSMRVLQRNRTNKISICLPVYLLVHPSIHPSVRSLDQAGWSFRWWVHCIFPGLSKTELT